MDKQYILVVDDNHINRLFFESSLLKLGYHVTLAEDGYQAVELCLQQSFHLILMDIRMNGLDGIQTANQIKQIEAHQNTVILAISAEHFNFQAHNAFAGGLLKPVKIDLLKQSLDSFLKSDVFNHQLALQVSHNDQDIVLKLRSLLIEQLPSEKQKLEQYFEFKEWDKLDDQLHKILGSAKVCAAVLLYQQAETTKKILNRNNSITDDEFSELKSAINKTISYAS